MKEKFIVTIPVYKSGNTKLTKYISEINCNTLIVPQISSVRADPSSLAYHISQKYNKSVIITINTVDTNLRFIQSRILGAELFKLNNFLITKGDATSLQKSPEKLKLGGEKKIRHILIYGCAWIYCFIRKIRT